MSHRGSLETFEYISTWIDKNFFFSRNDQWERMGMLGVLGDFILSSITGDIAEIGVGESSIYLTAIAKKYNRRIFHCDIAPDKIINPLTVPGYLSEDYTYINSYNQADDLLFAERCILFSGHSDDFFKTINMQGLALSFIDGDHNYAQAKKDFDNFEKRTVNNGYIILHDTFPPSEDYIDENHCGDVYKLRQEIEKDERFDCMTFTRGCAMGVGLTLVRKKAQNPPIYQS